MLFLLRVNRIRVTVFLEATLNLILLQVLLSFNWKGLAKACWLLWSLAFQAFLSEHVANFIRISIKIWAIVGVNTSLVIKIEYSFVAPIKLFCHIDFLARGWYRAHWRLEKDAWSEKHYIRQKLLEVDLFHGPTHPVENWGGALRVANIIDGVCTDLFLDVIQVDNCIVFT